MNDGAETGTTATEVLSKVPEETIPTTTATSITRPTKLNSNLFSVFFHFTLFIASVFIVLQLFRIPLSMAL